MNKSLLALALSAAFVAPLASAQPTQPASDASIVLAQAAQQGVPAAGAPGQTRERHRMGKPSERVEARLTKARAALKITDAQQPQWENFANVLRRHAHAMDERFAQRRARFEAARAQNGALSGDAARLQAAQPQRPTISAIERLERGQQRLAERSARLNEVIAAAKPLYAVFTPEQKQIADGMLSHHGRGGHGQKHRGMHRGA